MRSARVTCAMRGIGRAIAAERAEAGWQTHALGRGRSALEDLRGDLVLLSRADAAAAGPRRAVIDGARAACAEAVGPAPAGRGVRPWIERIGADVAEAAARRIFASAGMTRHWRGRGALSWNDEKGTDMRLGSHLPVDCLLAPGARTSFGVPGGGMPPHMRRQMREAARKAREIA